MELSAEQQSGLVKAQDWYSSQDAQIFRLFGYAGTGKTSTARAIENQLSVNVAYAAFTGKAASVLRSKGCENAGTVHSLIYTPKNQFNKDLQALRDELYWLIEDDASQSAAQQRPAGKQTSDPNDLDRIRELREQIEEMELRERPAFILKEKSELESIDLLILDEVSMVGDQMAYDLMHWSKPILVLGDPAQLPPIDGSGFFIKEQPDHLMTEIHRSGGPVIELAWSIRTSSDSDRMRGAGRRIIWPLPSAVLAEYDQVLVGKNSTRWRCIQTIRHALGRRSWVPAVGDRVMTIANNPDHCVFNGQQFLVLDVKAPGERDLPQPRHPQWMADGVDLIVADIADPDRGPFRLPSWKHGFIDVKGEQKAKFNGRGSVAGVTFAHAITVHKSQGSEWGRVLVIDESGVFDMMESRQNGPAAGRQVGRQWLYTAATRAAQSVDITIPA